MWFFYIIRANGIFTMGIWFLPFWWLRSQSCVVENLKTQDNRYSTPNTKQQDRRCKFLTKTKHRGRRRPARHREKKFLIPQPCITFGPWVGLMRHVVWGKTICIIQITDWLTKMLTLPRNTLTKSWLTKYLSAPWLSKLVHKGICHIKLGIFLILKESCFGGI